MAKNILTILQQYQVRKKRVDADHEFFKFLARSVNTFDECVGRLKQLIEISGGDPALKKGVNLAYSNLHVNIVTAFEVYYRALITKNPDWSEKGFESLLKESISLSEAYEHFAKKNVTRQFIVANYYSFNNFNNISSTFDKLIGGSFYSEIEKVVFESNVFRKKPYSLKDDNPNWKKVFINLYDNRNKFVHEGIIIKYGGEKDREELINTVLTYQMAIELFVEVKYKLLERLEAKKSKRKKNKLF